MNFKLLSKINLLWIFLLFLSLSMGTLHAEEPYPASTYVFLKTEAPIPGTLQLLWTPAIDSALWYEIQKSFNGIDFYTISLVATETQGYVDKNVFVNVKYWYRILIHYPNRPTESSNLANTVTLNFVENPYPIFKDHFDSPKINNHWLFKAGKWEQADGMLSQLDTRITMHDKKALLITKEIPHKLIAKLKVTTWSQDKANKVGIGVHEGIRTPGDQLVFSDVNQVKITSHSINNHLYSFPWKVGIYYWFKLVVKDNEVKGKIWQDGTGEPHQWLFSTPHAFHDNSYRHAALIGGGAKTNLAAGTATFDQTLAYGEAIDETPFKLNEVDMSLFTITTFAEGLNYPHSMQELKDNSYLVTTSDPVIGEHGYGATTGTLLRFFDRNQDGIADGPGEIKYQNLPGQLTALSVVNDLVFVVSSKSQQESINILRMDKNESEPYQLLTQLKFSFPRGMHEHTIYALAAREKASSRNQYEIFFNLGSQFNFFPDQDTILTKGLLTETLTGSGIYRLTIAYDGFTITPLSLVKVAKGLRNSAGIAFQPQSGDLYFEENGIDMPQNANEPLSVDSLYMIRNEDIGKEIYDFGFPYAYITYRSDKKVGPFSIPPVVNFQPIPDAYTGEESEGPSEIAFSPFENPQLNYGIFVSFHGKIPGGLANEENPVVFYDMNTRRYFHFISAREKHIGHIDGLFASKKALFLIDIASNGSLSQGDKTGKIYKITEK